MAWGKELGKGWKREMGRVCRYWVNVERVVECRIGVG